MGQACVISSCKKNDEKTYLSSISQVNEQIDVKQTLKPNQMTPPTKPQGISDYPRQRFQTDENEYFDLIGENLFTSHETPATIIKLQECHEETSQPVNNSQENLLKRQKNQQFYEMIIKYQEEMALLASREKKKISIRNQSKQTTKKPSRSPQLSTISQQQLTPAPRKYSKPDSESPRKQKTSLNELERDQFKLSAVSYGQFMPTPHKYSKPDSESPRKQKASFNELEKDQISLECKRQQKYPSNSSPTRKKKASNSMQTQIIAPISADKQKTMTPILGYESFYSIRNPQRQFSNQLNYDQLFPFVSNQSGILKRNSRSQSGHQISEESQGSTKKKRVHFSKE